MVGWLDGRLPGAFDWTVSRAVKSFKALVGGLKGRMVELSARRISGSLDVFTVGANQYRV